MNKKTKRIVSEEKIFGNTFVIIRRKYVPQDYKRNINIFSMFNNKRE